MSKEELVCTSGFFLANYGKTCRRGADRTRAADQENEEPISLCLVTVSPLKCSPVRFGE